MRIRRVAMPSHTHHRRLVPASTADRITFLMREQWKNHEKLHNALRSRRGWVTVMNDVWSFAEISSQTFQLPSFELNQFDFDK